LASRRPQWLPQRPAVAGDPSFMNNVPDPILSAAELPTFKFALEKSEGKVIGNSFGKELTRT
jgi:oxalate decarboxylase